MSAALTITPANVIPRSVNDLVYDTQSLMDRIRGRAYQLFEQRGRENGRDIEDWLNAELESFTPVGVEVRNEPDAIIVNAQAPGLNAEEIKLSLLPGQLTIEGEHHEKKAAKAGNGKEERNYSIYTQVNLPADVVPDKATATLKNGILEFSAPKATPAVQIQVKPA